MIAFPGNAETGIPRLTYDVRGRRLCCVSISHSLVLVLFPGSGKPFDGRPWLGVQHPNDFTS